MKKEEKTELLDLLEENGYKDNTRQAFPNIKSTSSKCQCHNIAHYSRINYNMNKFIYHESNHSFKNPYTQ